MKSAFVLAVVAAIVSTLAVTGGALAAKGGNSANAKLCQKGGWQELMDSSAAPFASQDQCVSHGAEGGAIYALARIDVELCDTQPADGICVNTSGFGLEPTTVVETTLTKNDVFLKLQGQFVQADGTVGGPPLGSFFIPCVAGNVYAASAIGMSASSLSKPTAPGIQITSDTVTRRSSCP
jgi:hypothetical protein